MPGYRDVPAWACGPAPLITSVQAAYDGSDALSVGYFKLGSTRATTGQTDVAEGTVVFERSGVEAPNDGATVLEQAEAAGLTPEFGCRMGICLSCVSRPDDTCTLDL